MNKVEMYGLAQNKLKEIDNLVLKEYPQFSRCIVKTDKIIYKCRDMYLTITRNSVDWNEIKTPSNDNKSFLMKTFREYRELMLQYDKASQYVERYNIYANNMLSNRVFNLGITIDKTEEWVRAEVERLNDLKNPDVVYFYEEV